MESKLIPIPYNKLVLKKEYIIKTNGLVFTGTYRYMFSPEDIIHDMLGLGQPAFIDVKPKLENEPMLICSATDKFYELKVKIE